MTRRMLPAPLFPLAREFNDVENRLRRLLGPDFAVTPFPEMEAVGWVPNVEIVENDTELLFTAELPGMKREDVELTVENEVLTIRGKKEEEKKEQKNGGAKYLMWERAYGEFVRAFTLPRTIDTARITAEMKDGLLKVHLPKGETAKVKGKKIEIANR